MASPGLGPTTDLFFWPNYPQKCMILRHKSSHNICHFTHVFVKCTLFLGFSGYKTLLFVVSPLVAFFLRT